MNIGDGLSVPKLFCIISQPRSGSNRLISLLNSHPAIVCHGELFHGVAIYSKLRRWPELSTADKFVALLARNIAPRRFLNDHISQSRDAWPRANAIGFKHFPFNSRRVLRYISRSQAYEVIYLKRNNTVLQYASDRTARKTNIWLSKASRRHYRKAESVRFSMRDFSRYVARLDHYDKVVRSALRGKSFLEIAYEDMDPLLPVIQERLGVEALKLRSRMQKQGPDDWVERFSNPDRVLKALKSTKFAAHLR